MYRNYQAEHEGQELREAALSINVLKLGDDVALATNPCELFTEFGLQIRRNSGVKHTLVGELTNGCFGYAPTQSAFAAGGYEVRRIGISSFLEVTAGEKLAEACLDLMKDTRTDG